MRRLLLVFLLAGSIVGCQTQRTAYYRPGCSSCGPLVPAPAPAPEVRLRPFIETNPPPLAVPNDPLKGEGNGPSVRLLPPRVKEEAKKPEGKEPPVAVPGPDDGPLPIELPGFAMALTRVATGLQPFPEGIDWLKKKGYKTAIHLRAPGDDGAAARRQFEKRGLTYVALDVSAATLDQAAFDAFVKAVEAEENLPTFVYDKDGSVTGGMWYLYFRLHKKETDEKSKAEAMRLGLRTDDDGSHRTMWLAVQAFAAKMK